MHFRRLLFCVLYLVAMQAFAQQRVYMVAKIADFERKSPIKGARAYNLNAKAGSITGANGLFFIWASIGDSIRLSAKGYNTRTILCQGMSKDSIYYLFTDPAYVTQLDEVVVEGKRPEQMKREIKELLTEAPETNKFDYSGLIANNSSPGSVGAGLSLSAIYDYFSKSGKDQRKANILEQQSRYKYYAQWRVNAKLVGRLTGLEGNDLIWFMNTLKLDDMYVLRASDYELNATILRYFEKWKEKH